ncbi:histone-lysine N-methyltransferase set-1-like [Onychostoma macrolepis]|uniref:histone-lysine N-methyltransferase set-1-like n=1 Tax=Onychostoma macrolepis TaxID=369639 RepID=UPI00272BC753|nr:histone-lysine N-methyltransferase set-1-like [Onychostoma macrolepis]
MENVSRRRRLKPVCDAEAHIKSRTDKPYLEQRLINKFKGRGVFTKQVIWKGDFVLEYHGKLLTQEQGDVRGKQYKESSKVFLFDFQWRGQMCCMDAPEEDGSLGRLVNDDHKKPNCKFKIIAVNNHPHLCLFAIADILPGQELTYNYGTSDWPWRTQVKRCFPPNMQQSMDMFFITNI